MKNFHLLFGLVVVVIFLLTGQFMDHYHNHLVGMEVGPRMLYRTRHIFILLAGLLNVGLGSYLSYRREAWRRVLQVLGSALIVVATVLFIVAFFYEPKLANLYTPLSHKGMYAILAGTFLHLFGNLGEPLKD